MVSTRTLAPACLLKASACFRNSSSDAGTKWFQLMNVSSRFCAKAGARPRASEVPRPAATPDAVRRKSRREVTPMSTLLGFAIASFSQDDEVVGPGLVSPPFARGTGDRFYHRRSAAVNGLRLQDLRQRSQPGFGRRRGSG